MTTNNQFNYALRSTTVDSRIISGEVVGVNNLGHTRSTPEGVSSPAPSKRFKLPKSEEQPVGIMTSGRAFEPCEEPLSQTTLGPKSLPE